MGLIEFVLDRIGEDRDLAEAAAALTADPEEGWTVEGVTVYPHIAVVHEEAARQHIARHDPAYELARCEALRKVVDVAVQASSTAGDVASLGGRYPFADGAMTAVRCIATAYAGHPDYQQEWRP